MPRRSKAAQQPRRADLTQQLARWEALVPGARTELLSRLDAAMAGSDAFVARPALVRSALQSALHVAGKITVLRRKLARLEGR